VSFPLGWQAFALDVWSIVPDELMKMVNGC
jgi:hypothetical protein